jgi:hypothetical protein
MGPFPVLLSLFASVVFAAPSERSKQTSCPQLDGKLPSSTPSDFHFSGNVRRYYIAAEEFEWDYAPTGWDNWLGVHNDLLYVKDFHTNTHCLGPFQPLCKSPVLRVYSIWHQMAQSTVSRIHRRVVQRKDASASIPRQSGTDYPC